MIDRDPIQAGDHGRERAGASGCTNAATPCGVIGDRRSSMCLLIS
jgi:hypothetical protein